MKNEAIKTAMSFLLIAIFVSAAVFVILICFPSGDGAREVISAEPMPVIVIDAGHGGRDGGAVGYDGTLEKELNLKIGTKLAELLRISGYNVVMTRSEDVMLTTDDTGGSSKMRDLKKRLEIASSYPDAVAVSIHCNKFPLESCKGLQVYCSEGDTAKRLAESIQESVKAALQPENHRAVKEADSSIYLLARAKTPSVLIECGFLSNPEECEKLKDPEYQKALALAVLKGITDAAAKDR